MSHAAAKHVVFACLAMIGCASPVSAEEAIKSDGQRESMPADSCQQFGPGYFKLGSTETCIKIGGSVRVDIGGGDFQQRNDDNDR
jgi:hypothetical protein